MKKSLIILLLVATNVLGSQAWNYAAASYVFQTNNRLEGLSSLTDLKESCLKSDFESSVNIHASEDALSIMIESEKSVKKVAKKLKANRSTGELAYSSMSSAVFSPLSPSDRRNAHWLVDRNEEELMPLAPDELDDIVMAYRRINVERDRRVSKERTSNTKIVKIWYEEVHKDAHVEVYLSGGGFSGGIDPRIHEQIMISNSGLIQQYIESEVTGKREYEKKVDRDDLMALVKWIAEHGFFEFEKEYDCADNDELCFRRIQQRPTPIPLKVVVAIGPYRNVVTVPIFSPEKQHDFVDYPKNLRKIVQAIYDFASL